MGTLSGQDILNGEMTHSSSHLPLLSCTRQYHSHNGDFRRIRCNLIMDVNNNVSISVINIFCLKGTYYALLQNLEFVSVVC